LKAGQLVKDKKFTSRIIVKVDNVTFENCLFDFNDGVWLADAEEANNTTWKNCTFNGRNGTINAVHTGNNGKVIGCKSTGVENGITFGSGTALAEGCYIADLLRTSGDPHYDGISVQGTLSGVTIRGNTIYGWDTSCIFVKAEWGKQSNILIENNLLRNQPGKKTAYTIYTNEGGPGGIATQVVVRNNKMEKGNWGYFSIRDSSKVTLSGNTDLSGNPIN
jgi:hypothetical protein